MHKFVLILQCAFFFVLAMNFVFSCFLLFLLYNSQPSVLLAHQDYINQKKISTISVFPIETLNLFEFIFMVASEVNS